MGAGRDWSGTDHADSCRAHRSPFLLSQLSDICASCSQRESLWRNVTGFSLSDPSPSFISLPAASLSALKCFFILKGHRLEIQVHEKVITFSLQVCLSESLQIISGWNTDDSGGKCYWLQSGASLPGSPPPLCCHEGRRRPCGARCGLPPPLPPWEGGGPSPGSGWPAVSFRVTPAVGGGLPGLTAGPHAVLTPPCDCSDYSQNQN